MPPVNWPIWAGAVLSVVALFSYPFVFVRWPITRDIPWANLLLCAASGALVVAGVRRAWAAPRYRWLKTGYSAVLAAFSAFVVGSFVYGVMIVPRRLPASHGAPAIGQRAPDFSLADVNNAPVSLIALLSSPLPPAAPGGVARAPKGVLLIFYRGYW